MSTTTIDIEEYIPLVVKIVDRYYYFAEREGIREDLINVGIIGLIDAIEKFDSTKDIKFRTYASFRILGEIKDQLRKEVHPNNRNESRRAKLVSLDLLSEQEEARSSYVDEERIIEDLKKTIRSKVYSKREVKMLFHKYFDHMTNSQIGQKFGICESRVAQIIGNHKTIIEMTRITLDSLGRL